MMAGGGRLEEEERGNWAGPVRRKEREEVDRADVGEEKGRADRAGAPTGGEAAVMRSGPHPGAAPG